MWIRRFGLLVLILPLLALLLVGCGGGNSTVFVVVTPTATSTPLPTATLVATATATPVPTGTISGPLGYPAGSMPALTVYAVSATNHNHYYYVHTSAGQMSYILRGVQAGTYHVLAYLTSDPTLRAGYSEAVPCGLAYGCDDHTLIDVVVQPGDHVTNISPNDWYAPPGTFPPPPT